MQGSGIAYRRARRAAVALMAAWADMREPAQPASPRWAHLMAEMMLAADDTYCRGLGLIVATDEIHRADLTALGADLPVPACPHVPRPGTCAACKVGNRVTRYRRQFMRTPLQDWRQGD